MLKRIFTLFFIGSSFSIVTAQFSLVGSESLKSDRNSSETQTIIKSLENLFIEINAGDIDENILVDQNRNLTKSIFNSYKRFSASDKFNIQVNEIQTLSDQEIFVEIFVNPKNSEANSNPKAIIDILAVYKDGKMKYTLPLTKETQGWKSTVVGKITYHFPKQINESRAKKFDKKNTEIASKLGYQPDSFDFYMTSSYQEILKFLGYAHLHVVNEKAKEGYIGEDANTIFAIVGNEDFSHDIFHYYAAKLRGQNKRNKTVEEGLSYSWGNAYYPDSNGEMIEQKQLVAELKNYASSQQNINWLEIFKQDQRIWDKFPEEISVKSTLSSLLCDEIEKKKGIDAIKEMICAGAGDEVFFEKLEKMLGINSSNFNAEINRLIQAYQKS